MSDPLSNYINEALASHFVALTLYDSPSHNTAEPLQTHTLDYCITSIHPSTAFGLLGSPTLKAKPTKQLARVEQWPPLSPWVDELRITSRLPQTGWVRRRYVLMVAYGYGDLAAWLWGRMAAALQSATLLSPYSKRRVIGLPV
ncbi:hypothetical protein H4R33_002041 [Dimargaris cristalligena]|nr:hypothetical protein H4R33_002041 [Dimargaris cristalligena]